MQTEAVLNARRAAQVARQHAAAVDRDARFPAEAIDALKAHRLLAAGIPPELGGLGCSITAIAEICAELGRGCASTAAIFAMHQIQVMCLVRHGQGQPFFRDYLGELARTQRLIASATSEAGIGGDLRRSRAAIEPDGSHFRVHKRCAAVSYALQADSILVTARRDPQAGPGDQVLALVRTADCELTIGQEWDSLGMRGTCTPPLELRGRIQGDQVLAVPFAVISSMTMVPVSHVTWAASWLGLAHDAFLVAQGLLREDAARMEGSPIGARALAEAHANLQTLEAIVKSAAHELDELMTAPGGEEHLFSPAYAVRSNDLKMSASDLASRICTGSLRAAGLRGYANNSPHTLGRHVRDALGATLMIANDRLLNTNAGLLLVPDIP